MMNYLAKEMELINAMRADDFDLFDGSQEEAYDTLEHAFSSFVTYANTVIRMTVMIPIWRNRFEGSDPRAFHHRLRAPDGAVRQTFADVGAPQVYTAPDGSYEITACVLSTTDVDAAIEQLTGFDAERVEKVATTRFSLPAYAFAWSAAGDEGTRVYRAELLCDESFCYALCFSVPAGSGTKYDSIQDTVFASFGLNYDEKF